MAHALSSMTGFGRATNESGTAVEVKTVNARGLDIKIRLPPTMGAHEPELVKQVRSGFDRGRIDVFVELAQSPLDEMIDHAQLQRHVALANDLAGGQSAVNATAIFAALPRYLNPGKPSAVPLEMLQDTVARAIATCRSSRAEEGAVLQSVLLERTNSLGRYIAELRARSSLSIGVKRQRLQQRLAELVQNIDPQRFAQEVAMLAERLDVSEELDRLEAHQARFVRLLSTPGSGREMDFLCQELQREINTIASKCQDAELAQLAVAAKGEVERVREQVQNVE